MSGIRSSIFRYFCPLPLIGLTIAYIGFYIAHSFNVSIELAQTIFFPLFLLCLWRLPRSKAFHLPSGLVFASLACWGVSGLHVRGYLPDLFSTEHITMSRLVNDVSDDKNSREFFRRYRTIARAYSLPSMELLARRFADAGDAQKWIDSKKNVSLVLGGNAEWLDVSFSTAEFHLPGEPKDSLLRAEVAKLAKDWNIVFERDHISLIQPPGSPTPVLFAMLPKTLSLPSEPSELTLHFLAWLARSLSANTEQASAFGDASTELGRSESFRQLRENAFREDAIVQMTKMLGSWKSPAPLSLSRLILGTFQLSETLAEISSSNLNTIAAASELNAAQKMLRTERYPELISIVRNNFGVARSFVAETDEEFMKSRKEFLGTATITGDDGQPTVGARVAMINLILLERAGML